MPPLRPTRTLVLGTALLAIPTLARAQNLQSWLSPELGELKPRAEYRFTHYPEQPMDEQEQPTDLRVDEHDFSFTTPLAQDERNEWSLTADVRRQDIESDAVLPDSGLPFPTELWSVGLGGTYRHKFDNAWIAAFGVTVGARSDEPFASTDEALVRAIGMLRVPHGERNAWIFSLIYASDQEFVGGLPVPGLAYQYVPSDRFNAVLGVPFTSFEYKPLRLLTLEGQYFPLRRIRTRATYELFRPVRLFAGFDIDNDYYFLRDRPSDDERLSYYAKNAVAGGRFDLRHVGFQVRGGYAFDRFYFQGEDYSDRRQDRIDVGDGPFVMGGVSVRF